MDQTTKRLRFPQAAELADIFYHVNDGMVVRNNLTYLNSMNRLSLFTRPTQMGKSTLFSLAEKVYSKKEQAPGIANGIIERNELNARYVLRFNFLKVTIATNNESWQNNLTRIDLAFLEYIKKTVNTYVTFLHPELKEYFTTPNLSIAQAGDYLQNLADAISNYSLIKSTNERFMVLVDEYDRPLRETLFLLFENSTKSTITPHCSNYISFMNICKSVGEGEGNMVWLTGVVPIVLDLISEFKPDNLTFRNSMDDAVGLRDEDVDHMLEQVQSVAPFDDDQQVNLVREAIRDLANSLMFGTPTPLYHTRMVNGLMTVLLNAGERASWLRNLSTLPAGVARERAPSAVYKLLRTSKICREIAKDLVAQKDIVATLNTDLNLPDVATTHISKDDYLTLLVHLGIASVQESPIGSGHIFRPTSRYFRSQYLNELLGVTLAPLFDLSTVKEIYDRKEDVEEFLSMLPGSAMSKMIAWTKQAPKNKILELQFQGFLVGELHDHFVSDDAVGVTATQEDKVAADSRTDIQLRGKKTVLILELKQKASVAAPPTVTELNQHHIQLSRYINRVSTEEPERLVAGFVVVMYTKGTKFHVECAKHETK